MTVAQLCEHLTVDELDDWIDFASQHPFPADLIDLHGAMHCALLANINRAQNASAFEVAEFMILKPPRQPEPAKPKLSEAQRIRALFSSGG